MNDDRADLHLDRTPTGRLDEALPGPSVTPLTRLPNYRIAEGDPDVRGWDVLGADGRKIGEVDDLLVDTEALKVRYLAVRLDLDLTENQTGPQAGAGAALRDTETVAPPPLSATLAMGGLAPMINEAVVRANLSDEENLLTQGHHQGPGTRQVLIPIGNARLDPEHDRILLQGMSSADATGLPDYDVQDLDRDYEAGLRGRFDASYTHGQDRDRDFYAHDLYDEDRFYGARRQAARTAGLEPGRGTSGTGSDREITGELDRALHAPDHNVTRDDVEAEAALPGRGRS